MESTQQGIATELLTRTSIQALRKEARRNRGWAQIYHGFRPESLTRPLLLRGARAFAANPAQLFTLCNVFLDSIGVAEGKDQATRFAAAAESGELDEETKALCSLLASADASAWPRFAEDQDKETVEASDEDQDKEPAVASDEDNKVASE